MNEISNFSLISAKMWTTARFGANFSPQGNDNSVKIYTHLLNTTPYAFPRGEGAPKGRMRDGVQGQSGISLQLIRYRKITTRIPHQSKIVSYEPIFASFPPGEAEWCSRTRATER